MMDFAIAAYITLGLAVGTAFTVTYMRGKVGTLTSELSTIDTERNALSDKLTDATKRIEELIIEVAVNSEKKKALEEQLKLLDEAKVTLSDTFKALSSDALNKNNESFLELAKTKFESLNEHAKGELEKREQAFSNLVKPISKVLEQVDGKVQKLDVSFAEKVDKLLESDRHLRSETSKLVQALRTPTARGRWGEIQLRRVVELAGMKKYCDFDEQAHKNTDDGRLRPDMIVKLPNNKNIVIDAKAVLKGYIESIEADDETHRMIKLKEHARQIRDQIKSLGDKKYWEQFEPTPEFVILFLPGEAFLDAAFMVDEDLLEYSTKMNVMLATPSTLIAFLKAVEYGWREESLAQNAKDISALGRELFERLSKMSEHIAKVGRSLESSVKSYNDVVGSYEGRVMVSARKFRELGCVPETIKDNTPNQIERIPRDLKALPDDSK
ncbi:DNA recombination protein RmuC [Thermodesulfobacteriota bacterium]